MNEAASMEALFDRLWPIMRSISGPGLRQTHEILSELLPLEKVEVPSGAPVLDWIVPAEWVFNEAYVMSPTGERILDASENNLRIVGYSEPFQGVLSRSELDSHLHSLPDNPTAIPYVTSYYKRTWGFCLSQRERDALPEGNYSVHIDTRFDEGGSMTLMRAGLTGDAPNAGDVLISVNTCHPSLANNELSGPIIAAHLYRRIAAWPTRRRNYRFVFVPETIGALAFLAEQGEDLRQSLIAGLVLTCVGDDGPIHYKRSRRGDALIDRAVEHVLERESDITSVAYDFTPWGSDERQYCSPGFNLPVGTLMRAIPGQYHEYHTSLDDKQAISFAAMARALDVLEESLRVVDRNTIFRSLSPNGEPKLDKHGLYPTQGGMIDQPDWLFALRWVLNLADGENDLLSIAKRSGMPFGLLADVAAQALAAGLLEESDEC